MATIGMGRDGLVQVLAQLKMGGLELQFPRFDFREVKNVVDDREQEVR